jgi:archaemetzincin
MDKVLLTPISFYEEQLLEKLTKPIKQQFQCTTKITNAQITIDDCFNAERQQYSANCMLQRLVEIDSSNDSIIVGITELDLYVPVLTFIFGQAYLNGNAAIVSSYRLRNEYYGMKPDSGLLWKRLEKLIMHELGHSFGLTHCSNLNCVMISSTYVEDIDQKSSILCDDCAKILT